jgi:glycosyltransferase involved in cell wall biosynthesis
MISVVIAYMPIMPYQTQLKSCLLRLEKQECEKEIVVSEHPVQQYIEKNRLINEGIKKAQGDYIWLCDADFMVDDTTFLERMKTKLDENECDIIYPMFESVKGGMRIADGAPFARKEVFDRFGKFNEKLWGISWVTFPFLAWSLKTCRIFCSEEFSFQQSAFPFTKGRSKRHWATSKKMWPLFKKTQAKLMEMGLWNV